MRTLSALLLLALLSIAPLALAQNENTTVTDESGEELGPPEGASGSSDCPPDAYCQYGGAPAEEPCIHCTDGPTDTCMDGQQGNETCDPNVYSLGGPEPSRGPSNGSCENCRGPVTEDSSHAPALDTSGDAAKAVPAPAVAMGILAAAGAALVLLPRRG